MPSTSLPSGARRSRCEITAQAWRRRPASFGSLLLSFATTVLVFRNLREFEHIYWILPLMGFGQTAVYAVYAIYLPELFRTRLRVPFLPETRHQPLPE